MSSYPTTERGQDNWRVRLAMARLWVDAINKHGGDARLVHLPEIGIRGNTHFLMSDLNNVQIADQVPPQFLTRRNWIDPRARTLVAARVSATSFADQG